MVKSLDRREADRALERELIWTLFAAESRLVYEVDLQVPSDAERKALERLQLHYEGVREICRRVKRAFTDPKRVERGITLESILNDFRELAA